MRRLDAHYGRRSTVKWVGLEFTYILMHNWNCTYPGSGQRQRERAKEVRGGGGGEMLRLGRKCDDTISMFGKTEHTLA